LRHKRQHRCRQMPAHAGVRGCLRSEASVQLTRREERRSHPSNPPSSAHADILQLRWPRAAPAQSARIRATCNPDLANTTSAQDRARRARRKLPAGPRSVGGSRGTPGVSRRCRGKRTPQRELPGSARRVETARARSDLGRRATSPSRPLPMQPSAHLARLHAG